ncbi:MAG: twin-arginine translocase TatA/TatE family subunit [Thermomicrobiales bacterium]
MNILGIGLPEMGIIAVVALLIFGPDKLPEVMGQAGKMLRDFRSMTSNLTGEFEKTIAEAKDIGNSITGELGGMTKEVNSVANSVKRDLNKTSATTKTTTTASKSASTSSSSKSTTTASRSSTNKSASTTAGSSYSSKTTVVASTPKASKEDPVVDMSLFEPTPIERKSRARRATPAAIGEPTPRVMAAMSDLDAEAEDARLHGDIAPVVTDDAIQRARARRRNAGYARQSA